MDPTWLPHLPFARWAMTPLSKVQPFARWAAPLWPQRTLEQPFARWTPCSLIQRACPDFLASRATTAIFIPTKGCSSDVMFFLRRQ